MNIEEKFDRVLTSKIREMINQHESEAYEIGAWESFEASAFGGRNNSMKFVWIGLAASFLMAMSLNNLYTTINTSPSLNAFSHLGSVDFSSGDADLTPLENNFSFIESIDQPSIQLLQEKRVNNTHSGIVPASLGLGFTKSRDFAPISPGVASIMFSGKDIKTKSINQGSAEGKRCILFPAKLGAQFSPSIAAYNQNNAGWSAGIVAEIPLVKNLSLTSGVLYTAQSFSSDRFHLNETGEEEARTKTKFAGIELPLNLKYNFFKRKKKELSISAGVSALAYSDSRNGEQEGAKSALLSVRNVEHAALANLAVAFEFPIEKQLSVMVEPFMKMPLGNSFDKDTNSTLVGVNVRLNYSLAKLN